MSIYKHSYILTYKYTYKRININSKHSNTRSNTNLTQLNLTAQRTYTWNVATSLYTKL